MREKVSKTAQDNDIPPDKFNNVTQACDDSLTIQTHKVILVVISSVPVGLLRKHPHPMKWGQTGIILWDCDKCGRHVRIKDVSWSLCPAGPASLATQHATLLLCPASPAALAPPSLMLRPDGPASLAIQRGTPWIYDAD